MSEVRDMKNFVKYLDSYKGKQASLIDIMQLINTTNVDYYNNRYNSEQYVGQIWSPYQPLPISPLNTSINSRLPTYFTNKHVHKVNITSPTPNIPPPPKIKVNIDVNVNSLGDLISILKTHEYKETEEYNIDLKTLSVIKDELIQLNNMIGMENLKTSILNQLLYFIQELHICKSNDKPAVSEFKHTVISGPPGTGKTEIAKIIGKMYSKIGVLSKNVFKKVTRNDLVAGYLGQTALKTKAVINECLGGVLFIDEAYSLASGRDELDIFSKECIDTLCESLSDNKENLMVIIAGYDDELNDTFFKANRGLESRFIWRFKIDHYSPTELCHIFSKKIGESDWIVEVEEKTLTQWFEKNKESFKHYGRDMELLFTYTKIAHSKRIYGKPIDLRKRITVEDLNNGYETMLKNKKQVKRNIILDSLYV